MFFFVFFCSFNEFHSFSHFCAFLVVFMFLCFFVFFDVLMSFIVFSYCCVFLCFFLFLCFFFNVFVCVFCFLYFCVLSCIFVFFRNHHSSIVHLGEGGGGAGRPTNRPMVTAKTVSNMVQLFVSRGDGGHLACTGRTHTCSTT